LLVPRNLGLEVAIPSGLALVQTKKSWLMLRAARCRKARGRKHGVGQKHCSGIPVVRDATLAADGNAEQLFQYF